MISIFISIFTLCFILFFLYIKISSKLKIIDIPNNLNVHKNKIPTGAGIIFLLNFYFFLIIYKFYIPLDFFLLQKNLLVLIISVTSLCLISFYDDIYEVHPIIRLFFQVILIFFCTSLFHLELLPLPTKISMFLIIYFWVYTINIINFTDGVDGFLGVNALTFFTSIFFYFEFINNKGFIYYTSLIMIPLLVAYLCFNKPHAKVFMGDTGSVFIGFLIGFISIQTVMLGGHEVIIPLLAYTYIDCTLTLVNKILNKQYPWARLFDYYFLIPIKNKFSHKKVFVANCIYNLCIITLVLLQINLNIKYLYLLSVVLAILLLLYFRSFQRFKIK